MAQGVADGFQLGKFHALDDGRLDHEQRQIDAQQRKIGPEQVVQQHVYRDVEHRCRIAVDQRAETVFRQVADRDGQHAGKGNEQQTGNAEDERVAAIQRSAHDGGHA